MKTRLVLFLLVLTLLVFGTAFNGGNDAAQDQEIRGEAVNTVPQLTEKDAVYTGEDAITENQSIEIKNPTFEEVKDFILKDTTSQNKFVTNKYECRHFATDVNNNAEAAGIRCAFVLLCYRNGQHAVVGFETTDRGMIYIEPQTDAAIEVEVGGKYQDQKIVEILVSW